VAAAPAAPQERQSTPWPALALIGLAAAAGLAILARRRAVSAIK